MDTELSERLRRHFQLKYAHGLPEGHRARTAARRRGHGPALHL